MVCWVNSYLWETIRYAAISEDQPKGGFTGRDITVSCGHRTSKLICITYGVLGTLVFVEKTKRYAFLYDEETMNAFAGRDIPLGCGCMPYQSKCSIRF